jgi:hypothetical protein
MKTLKLSFIIAISLSLLALNSNAQIKVVSNALVGIGTTSPNSVFNLHVANGGSQTKLFLDGGQDGTTYGFGLYSAGSAFNGGYISTSSSHLFKLCIINAGGGGYNVGIGTSSPSYPLDVVGSIRMTGSVVTSDMRLKENINNMTSALGNLTKLQGVTYRLKKNGLNALTTTALISRSDSAKVESSESEIYNRDHIGFLAQDVQKVYPQLVYSDKDGMLSVDYVSLIPVLVESIKEITGKRDADNADFQNQLAALKDKMKSDSDNYEKKIKDLSDKIDQLIAAQKGK